MQSSLHALAPARRFRWKKPLQFGLIAALGTLVFAGLGELWLALTAPPPPPPARPQAVVLVLDTSGSMMFGALSEMKRAASAYVERQNLTSARVSVVSFDSESRVDIPLSRDAAAIKAAIDNLHVGGSTRMDLGLKDAIA